MASENLKEFNDGNFQSDVLDNSGAVMVDFWAPWCGPCRMVGPVIEELADKFAGKAVIGKINIDDNPEMQRKYGIMTIPTVMVFKGGQAVESEVGVQTADRYADMINSHI